MGFKDIWNWIFPQEQEKNFPAVFCLVYIAREKSRGQKDLFIVDKKCKDNPPKINKKVYFLFSNGHI